MKRILFVDDESNILEGFRRMFRAEQGHWEMEFALGGAAALRACQKNSFDVIVSDLRMPGIDGATLLGEIRDRYPNTARIILSGYADSALSARAISVAHRFLSKPCTASDLQDAIARVCSLQDLLQSKHIRKIVGTVVELPSFSNSYLHLMQALKDPNTSINEVANIIKEDVAMSAKVLHLANSAFFGLAQHVANLQSAATFLGMTTIKNLALASEAFRVFVPDARIPQADYDSLQRHAIETAAIASRLPVEPAIRDVVPVAALLHDVGSLFMASAMPGEFCSVRAMAKARACKVFEMEEELLGTSHAEIGAYLLGLWGIPDLAVEAIAHHNHPTRIAHSGLDCTVAVYVADLLAHESEKDVSGVASSEIDQCDKDHLETLGLLSRFLEYRKFALQKQG